MKTVFYILLLTVFASCKTQNLFVENSKKTDRAVSDSCFHYDPEYQYTIRQDDKLSISVWGQDEVSVGSVYGIYNSNEVYGKWLLVDIDGNIEMPKIGRFHAQGKTVIELRDTLRVLLSKWIVSPVVDVKVLNKEITVLGEIKNPGVIKVDKDRNNLMELIGHSGGFEFYADLKRVKVLRQEGVNVRVTNINLTKDGNFETKNVQLHPGDVVIVPSKKHKAFDKRIATIIPFTTAISAAAILFKLL